MPNGMIHFRKGFLNCPWIVINCIMDLSLIFTISHIYGLLIPFWQCNETF